MDSGSSVIYQTERLRNQAVCCLHAMQMRGDGSSYGCQSVEKGVTSGKRRHFSKDWHESPAIGSNHNKTAPIQKQFFGSLFQLFALGLASTPLLGGEGGVSVFCP
jgi:hypothetical protein